MDFLFLAYGFGAGVALISVFLVWVLIARIRKRVNINIRDASLSVEELEDHARKMALDHLVSSKGNIVNRPISRMNENYSYIRQVYKDLNTEAMQKRAIPPAAEWLLDNYYIIEEQVKIVRRDLKQKNYAKLPVLKNGHFKGYARIFAIGTELISHVDGKIEESALLKYLDAYQTHNVLFEREISVIPAMLRLALIESTRICCEKIRETQNQWNQADEIVEKWWNADVVDLAKIKSFISDIDEVNPSFIEHLFFRLRRSGRSYTNVLRFIDERLHKFATTTEAIAQKEHNAQAVNTLTVGNCMVSLKYVSNLNWVNLFEATSYLEKILCDDPDGTYRKMDIDSRSFYRRKVELLAKTYGVSELHIGREAISLAKQAKSKNGNASKDEEGCNRKAHVGYYLVGNGLKRLEELQKGELGSLAKGIKLITNHPGVTYMGSITIAIILFMAWIINHSLKLAGYEPFIGILVAVAILLPVSEIVITLVNWIVTKIKAPTIFPRLELKDGIPNQMSTMVVIPALITDKKRGAELLENLENHYLSNTEENLYFALIGAFKDSEDEVTKGDKGILKTTADGIQKLNEKYGKDRKDIFYFYNRTRIFNESDNNWTGWERKRGALMEFNELFLGAEDTSFSFYSNLVLPDANIEYVITLDADTILPFGMAKKMIGTMAHPLNRPVIDEKRGIVVEGHGLMQPRVSFDMDSSNRSIFSRIYTGQEGIDTYASAISDVYQDLFGEGIFTGKGIYDLKVFQQVLENVVPENAILSHDLLEGSYVRAALVSDLELVDSYPSKYNSFMARLHRWIRGDWQLLPWLSRRIFNKKGEKIQNPLTYVSIWKIVDNLRRSLMAPSLMILLFLGFTVLPGTSHFWLGLCIGTLGLPFGLALAGHCLSGEFNVDRIKRHITGFFGIKAMIFQFVLSVVFLPYQAFMVLDAVLVTLVRVLITKKNMLVWVTSADSDKGQKNSLRSYLVTMGISVLEGLTLVALTAFVKPESLVISLVLFAIWALSPLLAYYISKDDNQDEEKLEHSDLEDLRKIARKTWRYFEEFANRKNNYLAPDNYQEEPHKGIAYRTSPTNIGLGLLASLSGRDFGYKGIVETIQDLSNTVTTIEQMEKWNGHLYNWYDTRTLEPLKPLYVSTVDSGNLVCYLVTLVEGLKDYLDKPLVDGSVISGLKDTLKCGLPENDELNGEFAFFDFFKEDNSMDLMLWNKTLNILYDGAAISAVEKPEWRAKILRMVRMYKTELEQMAPWACIGRIPEILFQPFLLEKTLELEESLKTDMCIKTLPEFAEITLEKCDALLLSLKEYESTDWEHTPESKEEGLIWLERLQENLRNSKETSENFINQFTSLIFRVNKLSLDTKFSVLFEEKRQLFSIGYNIEKKRLSSSYYDLLASEARQTSYIAIARGEVPSKHWFKLGRSLTVVDRFKGLVSWSGTMFEYLMPLLIMKSYKNTLLDETYSFVIKSQKKYGKQRNMPWGASESSFNSLDINLDYQYKAIGVPWLGLKRGLIEDAVTAPYATFLALLVSPLEAYKNIKELKAEGLEGAYGYYEAADYTPERLGVQVKRVVIKSYMAHHQGMSLLAINNYLNHGIMQKRFFADPYVKAARLLLQEKVPLNVVFTKDNKEKIMPFKGMVYRDKGAYRKFTELGLDLPKVQVLSNGNYSTMITDKGTGYSRSKTVDISRWRADSIIDNYGMFVFIKNMNLGKSWSATYAPTNIMPKSYEVEFTSEKAMIKRVDGDIETTTEIVVASGDDVEIRRIKLKNNGDQPCVLELTSYFELVIAPLNSDIAHPAFSNLFIKTKYNPEYKAIIANRRPRGQNEKAMWFAEIPVIDGEVITDIEYETDRAQFIGRGRTIKNPMVIERDRPLSNTVGAVLDPIISHRMRVRIQPGRMAKIAFVMIMAESKEAIMELLEKYSTMEACDASFWLALTRSQVETKYLNIKAKDMELYQDMISNILFLSPLKKKEEKLIIENRKGQSSLWAYGISGDRPIVLVIVNKMDGVDILYELLRAHEYWRLKDLKVDLVILSQEENSYDNPLFALVTDIVYSNQTHDVLNRQGDVFILNTNNMPPEDLNLFCAAAKMIFRGDEGSMQEQLVLGRIVSLPEKALGKLERDSEESLIVESEYFIDDKALLYHNGIGGFLEDGSEYIIKLEKDEHTQAPWVNVIANQKFGFIVSEAGGGYTWSENSRENKLTPWSNDPVSDGPSEVFYLRDEYLKVWSINALPIREESEYIVRHGFGYSEFNHVSNGFMQSLVQFVPVEDTAKISIVKLTNQSAEDRTLSLTYYMTPVMGVDRKETAMHMRSYVNAGGQLMFENSYNREFSEKACFMDVSMEDRTVTGDRKEFFGNGDMEAPEALGRNNLSGTVGVGLNPGGAMQINLSFKGKETKEIVFVFGVTNCTNEICELGMKYRNIDTAKSALMEVKEFWKRKLQSIQVITPDTAMNIMLNGWLLYQTISCRMWAKSGFYQAGGAFGFRDQLQDSLSMALVSPDIAKAQILKHARHQFPQGDVLHWWHEPTGKGTRTRISDDYLWLPYVTSEYVRITGDKSILEEEISFIEEDVLREFEEDRYCTPRITETTATLYTHCILALEREGQLSERGLPLIGGGDWNDGMNGVGNQGKGESIWLGWFLATTLKQFIPICKEKGEEARITKYTETIKTITRAIEENGWDGNWYRRAFFDNGLPLGASNNTECKIDSIAQSWSVISGMANGERSERAMKSLEEYLVVRTDGLIKLLTPPFDSGDLEPGYIKSYVPGVRENGGQYTHAAAWVIKAFAMGGQGDKATELFGLINPINHTRTNRECAVYKVEPYVLAADVYSGAPHVGRGGWTWYTGSANWMYKVGIEDILGFQKTGDRLKINPCIPKRWENYSISYKYMDTDYQIIVFNPKGLETGTVEIMENGIKLENEEITLINDSLIHKIDVMLS